MPSFNFSKFLPLFDFSPQVPLVHRDLSWLQFNERVLSEAQKSSNPLLERVKFLAISASNLDEFFAIRVSALEKSIAKAQRRLDWKKTRRLTETRQQLLKGIKRFGDNQKQVLHILVEELAHHSVFLHLNVERKRPEAQLAREVFEQQIAPYIPAPERFDSKALNTLQSLQTAILLPGGFWLKIPRNLPLIFGHSSQRGSRWDYFFLDHLLALFLGPPQDTGWSTGLVRVTRDGDYEYDLADTHLQEIPDLVRSRVGNRERGKPIRLQWEGNTSSAQLQEAARILGLSPEQVFKAPGSLFLHSLWQLYFSIPPVVNKAHLKTPAPLPKIPKVLKQSESIFTVLQKKDLLLHHPYDSFDALVKFIEGASQDPAVLSIEQTIYRMDSVSPLLQHLKTAARSKKVTVVIELRARFDEWNNLNIAEELKKAGVKVFYGFGKLKLHAKVTLVTRKESGQIRYYTHLSTGNYHSATARSYTDLALLTAQEDIGLDARHFFDSVYEGHVPSTFRKMVVAPTRLDKKIHALIAQETEAARMGKSARIFAKVNALVDEETIAALYRASQAGVKVDLVVRGACSLVPGLKGISDNIRVVSILDHYLEHSRIYYFESSHQLYLSSADWMPRNFLRRLEIAFPIRDERLYSFLRDIVLPAYLNDTVQGQELTASGVWKPRSSKKNEKPFRSQLFFQELAEKAYRETSLE